MLEVNRPTVAVGCFVFNQRTELLMIKRARQPGLGLWTIPGGKVEFGESLVDACRREVWEETNLKIDVGEFLTVFEPRFEQFHYVILDYLGAPSQGITESLCAGDDAGDVAWVALDEIPNLPLTIDLMPVVEMALAQARSSEFAQRFGLG